MVSEVIDNAELIKEIEKEINLFKISFVNKFGFMPSVIMPGADKLSRTKPEVDMETIYMVVNRMLIQWHPETPSEGLRTKTRKQYIVIFRQLFMKACFDYGYGCTAVSTYLGNFDHATTLHGNRAFNNLLDTDRKAKEMCGWNKDTFKSILEITLIAAKK